jgi:galactokinase
VTNRADRLIAAGMSGAEARLKGDWFEQLENALAQEGVAAGRARAYWIPGRQEFVGKHTDYAGGRSLCCAIERGICLLAVPRTDCRLRVRDIRSGDVLRTAVDAESRAETGSWGNYVTTVARRIARNFPGPLLGAEIAFASDLPPAAGMSSSSALIAGVFAALSDVNELPASEEYRRDIASLEDLAAYLGAIENGSTFASLAGDDDGVGTAGGCEDHTAILLSRPSALVQYAFVPVRFEQAVAVPDGHRFVIATSGVAAEKTGAALARYNRASAAVATILGMWNRVTGRSDRSLAAAVESAPDSADRMRQLIRRTPSHAADAATLADRFEQFQTENGMIVPAVADALVEEDLSSLGALVDLSQECAGRLLGNQVPETVELARAARGLGATAASAFGAGFGGSVWALVPESRLEQFPADWARCYRRAFPRAAERSELFMTRAGPPLVRM